MSDRNYEIFSTMADIGIKVRGVDIKTLIYNSIIGFSELLGKFRKNRDISVKGKIIKFDFESYEGLIVKLLNELLYIYEVDELRLVKIENISFKKGMFKGILKLGKIEKNNFIIKNSIKAITYHNINIEKKRKYYYIKIIMDI
jgi:SHS2 domain-containing protein